MAIYNPDGLDDVQCTSQVRVLQGRQFFLSDQYVRRWPGLEVRRHGFYGGFDAVAEPSPALASL